MTSRQPFRAAIKIVQASGQTKRKILWKSLTIALDGLVEYAGLDAVNLREIACEYNTPASKSPRKF
jgi:hypothetical protein